MITSILMATGMTIGILVEVLLPSRGVAAGAAGGTACKGGGNVKKWLKNKLKALALPLGRSGAKVAEELHGIIEAIISWILNGAKEVVGWVSQNLWALVIGLPYMYMVMRK